MKRQFMRLAWLPLIGMSLSAATFNLNTGALNSGWQVTQTGGTQNSAAGIGAVGSSATGPAVVLTGTLPFRQNLAPQFQQFAWADPFGGAVWVGQAVTDGSFSGNGAAPGFYTYTYSFSAALGGTINLSGFTGDNGVISLNVTQSGGPALYSCTQGPGGTLCASNQTTVTASTGTLNIGAFANNIVTVTAVVQNLDGPGRNPSGYILAGSATTVDPSGNGIPEPSTYAMLSLGGLAMFVARRRRK